MCYLLQTQKANGKGIAYFCWPRDTQLCPTALSSKGHSWVTQPQWSPSQRPYGHQGSSPRAQSCSTDHTCILWELASGQPSLGHFSSSAWPSQLVSFISPKHVLSGWTEAVQTGDSPLKDTTVLETAAAKLFGQLGLRWNCYSVLWLTWNKTSKSPVQYWWAKGKSLQGRGPWPSSQHYPSRSFAMHQTPV